MLRRYSRIIAAIVVCFFTWTSGGVFSVAHAAQAVIKQEKAKGQTQGKSEGAEERFAKLTEELTEVLADAKLDVEGKKRRLIEGKAEIDTLDVEIRKQFAETEKRLVAAKLPADILERHRKFVKHYDDNLAEFRGNLERVEKAKDKKEVETEVERTRAHLEKVKAPSRHQKLDPNNLPFRQPKVIKREPRMKKEEFERDLKKDKHAWKNEKRIVVASTGPLAATLVADDLAETVDVQITPAIKAKALELGNNPLKIYEWVRNNIEFVPTWGSIQGAQMTMQSMQGNAFDTSSLLIALLRAAGVHSKYATGTVELPVENVMNWLGDFTNPQAAVEFMASGGIPVKAGISGGRITKVIFEHVWVEAFVDYIPSRGAKHVSGQGDTWIKLDPSYKQYTFTQGVDIKSAVPLDVQAILSQVQSGDTTNDTAGYVTGVNAALVQQAVQDYQARVQSYIQQNFPNATVGDLLGKKEIIKQVLPYLLGTLPYRTAVNGATFAAIPDTLRHKLTFNVRNDTVGLSVIDPTAPLMENSLNVTKYQPELAGKKITLSYSPATQTDEDIIKSFFPQPHADGTPAQRTELPSSLPAYLINMKPELRIDGEVVATGAPVGLGSSNTFVMSFSDPAHGVDQITSFIDAGVFQAIGLNQGKISQEQLTALQVKIEGTKTKLENRNYAGFTKDDLIGDMLYTVAMAYHAEYDTANRIASRTMGVNAITLPSETIFATKLKVMCLWGVPDIVGSGGLGMDAGRLANVVNAKNGNSDTAKQYLLASGMTSSALEHSVPEQIFSTGDNDVQGISAVKAIKLANDQGIPIYTISKNNLAAALPQLQVDQQVKDEICSAVNAGLVVTVSKANINFNGWNGCGYIVTDKDSCAAAYKISGGTNGSWFDGKRFTYDAIWGLTLLAGILVAAYVELFVVALILAWCIACIGFFATAAAKSYYGESVSTKDFLMFGLDFVSQMTLGVFFAFAVGFTVTFTAASLTIAIPLLCLFAVMLVTSWFLNRVVFYINRDDIFVTEV